MQEQVFKLTDWKEFGKPPTRFENPALRLISLLIGIEEEELFMRAAFPEIETITAEGG